MIEYTDNGDCIVRTVDGIISFIPKDEQNEDYRNYLIWLDGAPNTEGA